MMLALLAHLALASETDELAGVLRDTAARATPAVIRLDVDKSLTYCAELDELAARYDLVWQTDPELDSRATGSGFIVDPSGVVLTNHHVVSAATHIEAVLHDQRRVSATVLGVDPRTDLAVIKLDGDGPWPSLELRTEPVAVGDIVLAIGNPFDFQSTVSLGIVSAIGRRGLSDGEHHPTREIQDYIQTDAAVNPGSSGGPLLDLDGRVMGINTAIFAPQVEQNAGISFAIPATMAARAWSELARTGRVPRPWVGLVVQSAEVASDGRGGAEITRVHANSPAERAGLHRGDTILAVDGEATPSEHELIALLQTRVPNQAVSLHLRRGAIDERDVVLTPTESREPGPARHETSESAIAYGGLTIVEVDDELRAYFGLGTRPGLVVLAVEPGSASARMGWIAGDMITNASGKEVLHLADLALAKRAPVVLEGWRQQLPLRAIVPAE